MKTIFTIMKSKKSNMKRTKKKNEVKRVSKDINVFEKDVVNVMTTMSRVKQTLFFCLLQVWEFVSNKDLPLHRKVARIVLLSCMVCLTGFMIVLCLLSGPVGIAMLFAAALFFWAVRNAF